MHLRMSICWTDQKSSLLPSFWRFVVIFVKVMFFCLFVSKAKTARLLQWVLKLTKKKKKKIQACESVVKLDVRFEAKAEVWFLLCFVFLRRLCKGWHILSFRKSLFSIPFASNYWYLNANAGRGRLNANKRLRNHKNSKHLNQKSQEQNCQKWPILEVNFKHIRYKSIDGPSSIYRLQNHLHLLCAKKGLEKEIFKSGTIWNLLKFKW